MSRPKIKISKNKLKNLYIDRKLTPDQITRRIRCSKRTIFSRLYEYNIPIRHEIKRTDITKDKLKELYVDRKLTIARIAKMFNCSKSTIWTKLCQCDIKTRTRSEANKGKHKIKISKRIKSLYIDKKLDISKIAKRFNCSNATILRRLHSYDVPIRRTRINIPEDELEDLYLKRKMSIYQIAKVFNCNGSTVLDRLNQYDIPIRKKGELRLGEYRVEIPKEEVKNLYIRKKIPISKIKEIFNCNAMTLHKRLERYSVPIRNISEALKGRPSPMKGKHHTEETRRKLSMLTVRQLASGTTKRKDTSIEIKLEEELKRSHIHYQKQVSLCGITVSDFYLPNYKVVIYVDGDYWHNLPVVKNRDRKQNRILEQKGYQVLRFWEHEINRSVDKCVNKVKEYIKL